jgi:hypothetical protein
MIYSQMAKIGDGAHRTGVIATPCGPKWNSLLDFNLVVLDVGSESIALAHHRNWKEVMRERANLMVNVQCANKSSKNRERELYLQVTFEL